MFGIQDGLYSACAKLTSGMKPNNYSRNDGRRARPGKPGRLLGMQGSGNPRNAGRPRHRGLRSPERRIAQRHRTANGYRFALAIRGLVDRGILRVARTARYYRRGREFAGAYAAIRDWIFFHFASPLAARPHVVKLKVFGVCAACRWQALRTRMPPRGINFMSEPFGPCHRQGLWIN